MAAAAAERKKFRDRLLGMIVRVSINGEVIKTFATSERLHALDSDGDSVTAR